MSKPNWIMSVRTDPKKKRYVEAQRCFNVSVVCRNVPTVYSEWVGMMISLSCSEGRMTKQHSAGKTCK